MKALLEFDDAGAADDQPVKGVTVGDIRAWHDRIEALEVALREVDTACFKLCANHGFATGHGDTVVAMIEEIDAQISARIALDKDAGK